MDAKEEQIMRILHDGHIIRVVDGRWTDGFVDLPTLKRMIDEKKVRVFTNKRMKFVTLKD